MRREWTRYRRTLHRSASALLCALSAGTIGCTTGTTDLTSAFRRPPISASRPLAESESSESERQDAAAGKTPATSGFAKLFRRDVPDEQPAAPQESGRGRVYSAFVDRLPGRDRATRDPFAEAPALAAKPQVKPTSPTVQPSDRSRTVAAARPTRPSQPAVKNPAASQLSDEELWRMLHGDAKGTPAVKPASRSLAAMQSGPDHNATPEWARDPGPRSTGAQAGTAPRQSATLAAAGTANPADDSIGRASLKSEGQTGAPRSTEDETRARVAALLAEARKQQRAGRLEDAYRTAALAQKLAERETLVFAPRQEQPAELLRGIVADLQRSRREQQAGEGKVERAIASTADASAGVRNALHVQRQPDRFAKARPSEAPAGDSRNFPSAPQIASTATRADGAFPELHTWRSAHANRPLSLAEHQSRRPSEALLSAAPIRHQALGSRDEARTPQGPWLPRIEADRSHVFGGAEQSSSHRTEDADAAPLLAAADSGPLMVAPPPPLEIGAHRLSQQGGSTRTDGKRGTPFWWIVAGLALGLLGIARVLKRRWSADAE